MIDTEHLTDDTAYRLRPRPTVRVNEPPAKRFPWALTLFAVWVVLILAVGAAYWYVSTPPGPSPEVVYSAEMDSLLAEYNTEWTRLGNLEKALEGAPPAVRADILKTAAALGPIQARMAALTPPPSRAEFHRLTVEWAYSCAVYARLWADMKQTDALNGWGAVASTNIECQVAMTKQNVYAESMPAPK